MMMVKFVELLAGETEVLGENLPHCQFVHHKPHMLCPDANLDPRDGKPATDRLSYGTAMPDMLGENGGNSFIDGVCESFFFELECFLGLLCSFCLLFTS
jgi:hypothetical protein